MVFQAGIKHNNNLTRTMKLPFTKDDDTKRMMSGTSNGRNEIICEARELTVTGNAVQKCGSVNKYTQSESNMDLGTGDTTDYSDMNHVRESYIEEKTYTISHSEPHETRSYQTTFPSYERSSSTTVRFESDALDDGLHRDDYFKGKPTEFFHKSTENINHLDGNKNSALAIADDNHQPSFTSRESNPSVPSPNEHSKTSTLRISDKTKTDNDDDIGKADDAEQDRSITRHDGELKTSATTNEKIPDSEKTEKTSDWPQNQINDADTDCTVQCLYYTIECCECTIL